MMTREELATCTDRAAIEAELAELRKREADRAEISVYMPSVLSSGSLFVLSHWCGRMEQTGSAPLLAAWVRDMIGRESARRALADDAEPLDAGVPSFACESWPSNEIAEALGELHSLLRATPRACPLWVLLDELMFRLVAVSGVRLK